MRKQIVVVLATIAIAVGFNIASVSPAAAAYCLDHGCDGTNPETTGCSAGGVNVARKEFTIWSNYAGEVNARYSTTCKSQWTRVSVVPGSGMSGLYLSYINLYNGTYTFNWVAGTATLTWWTPQAGAANDGYYSSGTVTWGSYYGGATVYA